jgi:hypothetical protein
MDNRDRSDILAAGLTDRRIGVLLAVLFQPRSEASLLKCGPSQGALEALARRGLVGSRLDSLGQSKVWYRTGRGVRLLEFLQARGALKGIELEELRAH